MKLQSVALDDFRLRFPAAESRTRFDTWWNGISAAALAAIKPPKAYITESGFTVQYLLYEKGSLRQQILHINANGTVAEGSQNAQGASVDGRPGSLAR